MRNSDRGVIGPRDRILSGLRTRAFLLTLLPLALGGCLRDAPTPADPELAAELGLPPGTVVHTVHLAGEGDRTRVLPSELEVGEGALVKFVSEDHGVHSVRFLLDEMSAEAAGFLRSTQQTGSPPLTAPGARFVLKLSDAPPGIYPFMVEGYGPSVRAAVRVRE